MAISLSKTCIARRQCGTALVMALLFLLVLTILGVLGMGNARLGNMMAGNHQFQAVALSNAEQVISAAEQVLISSLGGAKPACYYPTTETIDPSQTDWSAFTNCTHTLPNGDPDALYVIEYAGEGIDDECSKAAGKGRAASCKHYDFVISTQAASDRGARRIVQVVYQASSPP